MKFFLIRLKNSIIPFAIYTFTIFLIVFSSDNLIAAKNGLLLWASSVVPSLFPFFIATELLGYTNIISFLGKFLNKVMRPIFNVSGEGSFALIMGIISGYPTGAKIVSNFKENRVCTIEECERLLAFTNNSGPLFIVGTVGISLFSSYSIGIKLLISHIVSALLVGFCFRFWKMGKSSSANRLINSSYNNSISFYNIGEILSLSIQSAIHSIFIIGGFVVLFSVIVSMLNNSNFISIINIIFTPLFDFFHIPNTYHLGIITGIIEVTNGMKLVAVNPSPTSIILCSFLLGFGGISVLLQVLSIVSKSHLSIKPYIIGKFMQACFSAIIMYFIL